MTFSRPAVSEEADKTIAKGLNFDRLLMRTQLFGEVIFNTFTIAYDNDYCVLSAQLDLPPDCTLENNGAPAPQPCQTLIELDGHHYELFGWFDFFSGGLLVTNARNLSNCRRANGSALPPTDLPTLVLGAYAVNIDIHSFALSNRPGGALIQLNSRMGDVVCDGELTAPLLNGIFANSFEVSP